MDRCLINDTDVRSVSHSPVTLQNQILSNIIFFIGSYKLVTKVMHVIQRHTQNGYWKPSVFSVTQQPQLGLGRLKIKVSRTHTIRVTHPVELR
jgi:hypothetical protein